MNDILANRIETFAPLRRRDIRSGFQGYIQRMCEENDLRFLWLPLIVFCVTAGATVIVKTNPSVVSGPQEAYAALAPEEVTLITKAEAEENLLHEATFEKRHHSLANISLEKIREAAFSVLYGEESKDEVAAIEPINENDYVSKQREHVMFIAGMIAANRNIQNRSDVARHIVEQSHNKDIDPLYVAAVISTESNFLASARSKVGATGLMQLMPDTAREVAQNQMGSRVIPSLTDPKTNISLGIDYLKYLEAKYKGDRFLALAAYNWGPGNVDNALQNKQNIPRSVRQYAKTIMEKTTRWETHFSHASAHLETTPVIAG